MNVIQEIAAERARQKSREGWTEDHDDEHDDEQLARAAACYAIAQPGRRICPSLWPWDAKWWKPKDRRNNLIRAGALIVAEIERLDRQNGLPSQEEEASTAPAANFRWVWIKGEGRFRDDVDRWELLTSAGLNAATVYENGVWFVWDKAGIGGENATADSVQSAKWIAYCATLGWAQHGYGPLLPEKSVSMAVPKGGNDA